MIASRLRTEYGVEVADRARDVHRGALARRSGASRCRSLGGATTAAVDRQERRVLLFAYEWEVQYFEQQNPTFALLAESPVA